MLTIHDVEQGTPEWLALRAGKPTASNFATVLAEGRTKGSPSVTRRKYQMELLGQRMTGAVEEGYKNAHMERGNLMEDDARREYAFMRDVTPTRVGFAETEINGHLVGASPDSLVGEDGLLEIKTALPHILLEWILAGRLPPEHVAQVQGQMMIMQRQWCDFVGYWPGLPLFVVRVFPDLDYHAKLRVGLVDFCTEIHGLHLQVMAKA